jgi:hypothetical protein
MNEQLPSDSLSIEPLTLTNRAGTDFDISRDGDDFMVGLTPAAGHSTWAYIDLTQATALRNWLNKAIP